MSEGAAPDRRAPWSRGVAETAVVTFLATTALWYGFAYVVTSQTPPAPKLKPHKSITVTLYPVEFLSDEGTRPVAIPQDRAEEVIRLVTPEKYFPGGVDEWIHPVMARVDIVHPDGAETSLLVRETGHNPAAVTVDGRNYFYATNAPEVHAGAIQLAGLVREFTEGRAK